MTDNPHRRVPPALPLLLGVVCVLLAVHRPAAQQEAADIKAVAAVIEDGIRRLEAKDYGGFLRACLRPSEVEELVEQFGSIEKAGDAYGQTDRPAGMLAVLKAARAMTPTFTADGVRAEFTFAEPVGGERRLQLQKIEGRWYLRD